MGSQPVNDGDIVLWENAAGLRCTFARRPSGPPYEVTLQRGADILQRVAFEHDVDASNFAIAAMRDSSALFDAGQHH